MPTISSRTPDGYPCRCPLCGQAARVDLSLPPGDAPCPHCGHLLWWYRDRTTQDLILFPGAAEWVRQLLAEFLGRSPASIGPQERLLGFADDTLDLLEFVLTLEERLHIAIPDWAAEKMRNLEDVVRYIEEVRPP